MKRIIVLIISIIIASQQLFAQGLRKGAHIVSPFIEWGTSALFCEGISNNFICSEGYRIDDERETMTLSFNGFTLVGAGFRLGGNGRLRLSSGTAGVSEGRRMIPILLGYEHSVAEFHDADACLFFFDGGAGIPYSGYDGDSGIIGRVGAGYRMILDVSRGSSLDFKASARVVLDHPGIVDPDTSEYVTGHNVRKNNVFHYALCFSAALNF